ncbi:MAG: quercetin 2,3-dioxygenase [Thauera sp.]|jgi:redox-sensitive bicupin YhaK (pirin superfamily)|nr:quercetin 2,3-dioxygenase [Thauera sp.]
MSGVLHRDSLGNEQVIRPGQVNPMTARHGIAHTEDSLRDGTVGDGRARRLVAPPLP